MIQIVNVTDENDYKKMLEIEGRICKENPSCWHWHFGGIGFDRYFFGEDNSEVYEYGKLIKMENESIGYCLIDLEGNEWIAWVLPEWEDYIKEIVIHIETYFPAGTKIHTVQNGEKVINELLKQGYEDIGECKFTAALDLNEYKKPDVHWEKEEIRLLEARDDGERAKYSGLPTGGATITEERVKQYRESEDFKSTVDYVVVDPGKQNLKGYYSWWIDKASNTAMLNPVACIEAYRRQRISRRAILHGLNELKDRGIAYAYVDTSIGNDKAIGLYEGIGFCKCKKVFRLTKTI